MEDSKPTTAFSLTVKNYLRPQHAVWRSAALHFSRATCQFRAFLESEVKVAPPLKIVPDDKWGPRD